MPISAVGSRLLKHVELPLIRYDIPPWIPPSSSPPLLEVEPSIFRASAMRYRIILPTSPIGPDDLVSILLSIQPNDPAVSIRSATLVVDRRIQLSRTMPSNSYPLLPTPPYTPWHQNLSLSSLNSSTPPSSISSLNGSTCTLSPQDPSPSRATSSMSLYSSSTLCADSPTTTLLRESSLSSLTDSSLSSLVVPTEVPPRIISNSVVEVDPSGQFVRDKNGFWNNDFTFQWPTAKSYSRWAMGETLQTELASVRFFVRVKVCSSFPFPGSLKFIFCQLVISCPSGSESFDLAEQELIVVLSNDADRQVALSKFSKKSPRSRSKSARRIKRDQNQLPSPSLSPCLQKSARNGKQGLKTSTSTSTSLPTTSKGKSSLRRPHTSAGPSNVTSVDGQSSACARIPDHRSEEGHSSRSVQAPGPKHNLALAARIQVDRVSAVGTDDSSHPSNSGSFLLPSKIFRVTKTSSAGQRSVESLDDDERKYIGTATDQLQVRAWEKELERIENESRRVSENMRGSLVKRRRVKAAG